MNNHDSSGLRAQGRQTFVSLRRAESARDNASGTGPVDSNRNARAGRRAIEIRKMLGRMKIALQDAINELNRPERDGCPDMPGDANVLQELIAAADLVADRFDASIATLCVAGNDAQAYGRATLLAEICRRAAFLSRTRNLLASMSRRLESLQEHLPQLLFLYACRPELRFELSRCERSDADDALSQFTTHIGSVLSALVRSTARAVQSRDFDAAIELASLSKELDDFLVNIRKIQVETGSSHSSRQPAEQ